MATGKKKTIDFKCSHQRSCCYKTFLVHQHINNLNMSKLHRCCIRIPFSYLVLYSFLHRAKMDWNVWCISDQASIWTKHGAWKVKSFLKTNEKRLIETRTSEISIRAWTQHIYFPVCKTSFKYIRFSYSLIFRLNWLWLVHCVRSKLKKHEGGDLFSSSYPAISAQASTIPHLLSVGLQRFSNCVPSLILKLSILQYVNVQMFGFVFKR